MKVKRDSIIPDVLHIVPERHYDDRGFFSETYSKKKLEESGFNIVFVQDNCSISNKKNTIRGLHYQREPYEQGKLVRCSKGSILDVAVDIRKESPTFGKWISKTISFGVGNQLYIPEGFLHGFKTLENETEVNYKCTAPYNKDSEVSIFFNDKNLNINWELDSNDMIVSDKDLVGQEFIEFIETIK